MKKDKVLENIIVMAAAALAGYFIFKASWLLAVSFGFLVLGIIGSKPAYYVAFAWKKFSEVLGGFTSKILLSLIFFLFLTPLSFLFRIFNKDSAGNFLDKKRQTHLQDKNKEFTPQSFEKQW